MCFQVHILNVTRISNHNCIIFLYASSIISKIQNLLVQQCILIITLNYNPYWFQSSNLIQKPLRVSHFVSDFCMFCVGKEKTGYFGILCNLGFILLLLSEGSVSNYGLLAFTLLQILHQMRQGSHRGDAVGSPCSIIIRTGIMSMN